MRKYFTILISLIFSACGNSQTRPAINQQNTDQSKITEEQAALIFEKTNAFPNNTQLAIALIKNGQVHFYGVKRENDTIRTITNHDRVFEIGSISKVFTGTLLAELVEEGKIDLSQNINEYLDFPFKDNQQITFLALANHTSGLPRLPSNLNLIFADPTNPYKGYDEEKLKVYLTEKMELAGHAGKKSDYSNLGFGLLGYVLSEIDKKTYQELATSRIFSKYDMSSTTTIRSEITDRLVKGLTAKGVEASNWDLAILAGAGGILSTVEDMSRFAMAQFDPANEALALSRTKTFELGSNMDIGLGWVIINKESGSTWHWHNGGTGGYTSSMALDVEKQNGVIILSNVSAFNKKMGNIDQLCFGLLSTLE